MGKKSRMKRERRQQPWLKGERLNPDDPANRTAIVWVAMPAEANLDDPSLRAKCQRCQAPLRLSAVDGQVFGEMKAIAAGRMPQLAHVVTTSMVLCGRCANRAVKAWADSIQPAAKPRAREWTFSSLPGAEFLERVEPGEPEEIPAAPRADRAVMVAAGTDVVLFTGPAADLGAWFGLEAPPPPVAEPA
jgi:hypothetical protein